MNRSLLGAVGWTVFGLLNAVFYAATAFMVVEFVFHLNRLSDGFGPETDSIRFLFVTLPALLLFAGVSLPFPRWPALLGNVLFTAFVIWRAWEFHLYAGRFYGPWEAVRSSLVCEWTVGGGLLLLVGMGLWRSRGTSPESIRVSSVSSRGKNQLHRGG